MATALVVAKVTVVEEEVATVSVGAEAKVMEGSCLYTGSIAREQRSKCHMWSFHF